MLASIALGLIIVIRRRGDLPQPKRWDFAKSEWDNWLLLAGFIRLIFTKRLRLHELFVVIAFLDMAYTASWLRIG